MASLAAHTARAGPRCCRFAGDVRAFDDEDALTLAREVIGDGVADYAAADDGDVGKGCWHGLLLFNISGGKATARVSALPPLIISGGKATARVAALPPLIPRLYYDYDWDV